MKALRPVIILLAFAFCWRATASAGVPFIYKDGLVPRDEWGKLASDPPRAPD